MTDDRARLQDLQDAVPNRRFEFIVLRYPGTVSFAT